MRRDIQWWIIRVLVELIFHFNQQLKLRFSAQLLASYNKRQLKRMEQRINREHPNGWIFLIDPPIGELVMFCWLLSLFKAKHEGEVSVVVRDAGMKDVAKLFPGVDHVYVFADPAVFWMWMKNTALPYAPTRSKLARMVEVRDDDMIQMRRDVTVFMDRYRNYLGLAGDPRKISEVSVNDIDVSSILKKYDGARVVFLAPDASTIKLCDDARSFWMGVADELKNAGYRVVFNARPGSWGTYDCEFLSLIQSLAFAKQSHAIVGVRCGFLDLIACCRPRLMVALYAAVASHVHWGRAYVDMLRESCPLAWKKDLTDDENFREFFSMRHIFEKPDFIVEKVINRGRGDDVQMVVDAIARGV